MRTTFPGDHSSWGPLYLEATFPDYYFLVPLSLKTILPGDNSNWRPSPPVGCCSLRPLKPGTTQPESCSSRKHYLEVILPRSQCIRGPLYLETSLSGDHCLMTTCLRTPLPEGNSIWWPFCLDITLIGCYSTGKKSLPKDHSPLTTHSPDLFPWESIYLRTPLPANRHSALGPIIPEEICMKTTVSWSFFFFNLWTTLSGEYSARGHFIFGYSTRRDHSSRGLLELGTQGLNTKGDVHEKVTQIT